MATFISTIKFTPLGLEDVRRSPKRAAALKKAAKKMGVKVKDIYWTLGDKDGFLVFDAPDDETATAAMLFLSRQGNVQTNTSRAYSSSEMEKILGMMGKR
jgi:uncharacterized protein with GYD domain